MIRYLIGARPGWQVRRLVLTTKALDEVTDVYWPVFEEIETERDSFDVP